jgi:organic radical activating enzyme
MDMNYRKIRLLEQQDKEYFLDCVDELYSTIEQDASFEVERTVLRYGREKNLLIRFLGKFQFLNRLRPGTGHSSTINFASMISGDFKLFLPYAFRSRQNFIYMYDVWPRFQQWIFPLLDFFNIRFVFFSSKQVFEDHLRKYPQSKCKSMWLPEAIKANDYHFESYTNKDIDVLEFGRIYRAYHERIAAALQSHGRHHVYRRAGEVLLFPDKHAFVKGLARAKITVCVPSNITHPERAEYISTMTLRYLQAMASKVLIVGIMPQDMKELFPYTPIVEIDMDRAAAQLLEVLESYKQYIPLIERNYLEVVNHHQWQNRWALMKAKMEVNA